MMKKLVTSLLLSLAVPLAAVANDGYDYLVFSLQDGTTQTVEALGATITFDGANALVTNGTTQLTIPVANLATMFFSNEASTTGIGAVETHPSATNGSETTEIYTLDGVRVADMSRSGIYIIKKNGRTYKQVVK